jgi:dTDP-4-dehydrorhamnose 3,5-epimerase
LIDGVQIIPLRKHQDERGDLMHMLRSSDPHFRAFGEIYFSTVKPGAVKAWHLLHDTYRHYAVPVGTAKVVLFDDRAGSPSFGEVQEIVLGENSYSLLVIPPEVWSGFAAVGGATALIADCATAPHDPARALRKDAGDPSIPYQWDVAR